MDYQPSAAERRLLAALPADGAPLAVEEIPGFVGQEALRVAGAPERHGLVAIQEERATLVGLSEEGLRYKVEGLPERRAVQAMQERGGRIPMAELSTVLPGPEVKVAIGWLKRKGWADMEKGDGGTDLVLLDEPATGPDEASLAALGEEPVVADGEGIALLRSRSGVLVETERTRRAVALTEAGQAFVQEMEPPEEVLEVNQVTPEFLARWHDMPAHEREQVRLRRFDFDVPVAPAHPGKTHPLSQMMAQIRDIFWGMGFQEIAGDYVESAFWNMDALFIPQDHPAREMQDTFYLEHPATLPVDDADLARGKAVHEEGGDTGSTGWGGSFSEEVARQALLRTHTTNTTVRYLAEHPAEACKVFGLGKVFRKETMDATHLPEFYQIEGIVHEDGANFNMLVGLCKAFFARMGFPEVRFRPAYFPYTEPSMEIDVHYNGKWMELGGCGVFRPEVTKPLGVPHPVLAWGFGLERLAMMRLGLTDIRDLYVSDIRWLQETALQ